MLATQEITQGKTLRELGLEALWFTIHTLLSVAVLAAVLTAMTATHPDPDSYVPKLLGTVFAFFVPLVGGFCVAKIQGNIVAKYVWISGLLLFSVVCVWVLDLPTGNGLCESCGAVDKLWRTFFDIRHGSGLMAGDGLLIGTWIPLSTMGYAVGAQYALED